MIILGKVVNYILDGNIRWGLLLSLGKVKSIPSLTVLDCTVRLEWSLTINNNDKNISFSFKLMNHYYHPGARYGLP